MHLKLYGQDSVLASIHRMLDSLQDERDSVMLVEGAPGSGKTHLLDVTAGEARQRGVPTARITPEALPLCPPEGPARPRLILVDDAHEISAETLRELVGPLAPEAHDPVALLLTLRDSTPSRGLDRLLNTVQPEPVRLVLRPLSPAAVIRLATDMLGAPPEQEFLDWTLAAGGDPRLTRALVEGLIEENGVRVEQGRARLVSCDGLSRPLPRRVHQTVRALLSTLSPQCRQLLYTAAVLGPRLDPEPLARMLGQSTAALLPAWEEGLSSDILRHDDHAVIFAQELVRRTIAESLPITIRAALRRQRSEPGAEPPAEPPAAEDPAATPDEPGAGFAGPGSMLGRLTPRERTVLDLLARGSSNRQISRAMEISGHAVKRHVSNLLIKFDCSNRTEVALMAVRLRGEPVQGQQAASRPETIS